ncbi:MAG: GNAT family N-acetyltransferase [Clostridiales bacterium]|nr:GNAT family N-acetyltransferase [Clostridiales bacterium]
MGDFKYTVSDLSFETKRLLIRNIIGSNDDNNQNKRFAEEVLNLLTARVTEYLPDGCKDINNMEDALKWINDRHEESTVLSVKLRSTDELVGLIFLYESETQDRYSDLRFGYLISETIWGKGYGTELIGGLVGWCENSRIIKSLSGGVATKNVGSVRIMEKCGFAPDTSDGPVGEVAIFTREFVVETNEV